jgi:uncharacterized protein
MGVEIAHEPDARRYVLRIDGDIVAVADYAINGNNISFTHTFTNPRFRGQGYAGKVVTFAMDDVEATTTYRVIPMCWYVADWFEANPARRGLLERAA